MAHNETDPKGILIKNANLIDGTGAPAREADILIRGDIIERMAEPGLIELQPGTGVIDARGKTLTPGFIDIHAHSDWYAAARPEMAPKIMQGVTTVVVGNCGLSAAPVSPRFQSYYNRFLSGMFGACGEVEWETMGEYLDALGRRGTAANIIPLVGLGNLRVHHVGLRPFGTWAGQRQRMIRALEEAMEQGAWGLSSGLAYPPQNFVSTDDLIALCKAVRKCDGFYFTHVRNETDNVIPAVEEAIEIARAADVPVHISHLKSIFRRNWGKTRRLLELLDQARDQGLDAAADMYPYTAFGNVLLIMLPFFRSPDIGEIIILSSPARPEWDGLTIGELAEQKGVSPAAAYFHALRHSGFRTPIAFPGAGEDDLVETLRHPAVMIGSDGNESLTGAKTHPRLFGTCARFIETYVLERGIMGLEQAVHKMTGLPARRLRLDRRGLVAEGFYADLCLFDPAGFRDHATYKDPNRFPSGMDYVFVNGRAVVIWGKQNPNALPGRALKNK